MDNSILNQIPFDPAYIIGYSTAHIGSCKYDAD